MNSDFKDMLSALSAAKVEFMVVGAYAVAAHGYPRATGDMDVWVRPSAENAEKVMKALLEFGAPLKDLTVADLREPDVVFQIGVTPGRIDILTKIDEVGFDDALSERKKIELGGRDVFVIGKKHLIQNKKAVGRPKDMAVGERRCKMTVLNWPEWDVDKLWAVN